jgi:hypothetical protein
VRVAALIIGLFVAIILLVQSCAVFGLSGLAARLGSTEASALGESGAVGVFVAILSIVGAAFALHEPGVATALFGVAAAFAYIGQSGGFADLGFWAWVLFGLAALSFGGRRELRRAHRERFAEAPVPGGYVPEDDTRPPVTDDGVPTIALSRLCPRGHMVHDAAARFCPACGAELEAVSTPAAVPVERNLPPAYQWLVYVSAGVASFALRQAIDPTPPMPAAANMQEAAWNLGGALADWLVSVLDVVVLVWWPWRAIRLHSAGLTTSRLWPLPIVVAGLYLALQVLPRL